MWHIICLRQGGPAVIFPWAKNSFPIGPKGQETPHGTSCVIWSIIVVAEFFGRQEEGLKSNVIPIT